MKDFYYILGTDINCTSNDIREAYRKLSKKFHPDLNENDHYFESRFKEIREAYETLSDPARRSSYDAALKKAKPYPIGEASKKLPFRFKTKYIDIAFSITLIVMTLGFGYYVYRSIGGSKVATVKTVVATVSMPAAIVRHKKKHRLKIKAANAPDDVVKTSNLPAPVVKTSSVPAVVVNPGSAPVMAVKSINKPTPIVADTVSIRPIQSAPVIAASFKRVSNTAVANNVPANANISYLTSIKANATGVVYLRKVDAYNSDVVMSIPTNSKVVVLEKGKTFYKVLFDHKTGYVPIWTIQDK
jgi:hypothetical protein